MLFSSGPKIRSEYIEKRNKMLLLCLAIKLCLALNVHAEVYFKEGFDKTWQKRWVQSNVKSENECGKFEWTAGKFYGDSEINKGLQTSQDSRFYGISAKIGEPFTNKGKTLVVQFSVKHEQNIDCGGGYIKVLPSDVDQEKFGGDTPYYIMFGPVNKSSSPTLSLFLFEFLSSRTFAVNQRKKSM